MFLQVSYWTAFSAGVASFFSPCLLPLIPAYIMYMAGAYDPQAISKKRTLMLFRTFGFIIGFTVIFMLLGISASALGRLFAMHKVLLTRISGILIVFFGLYLMGFIKLPMLNKDYRKSKARGKMTFFTSIGMGMAFAFGWTPCFGPILGAILASTAAMSQNVAEGARLLWVYSMGMAVPFIITALFINTVEKYTQKLSQHSKVINRIAGAVLALLGLLMATGKLGSFVNRFL
ncbi:cytochrome c biogenesis CcdA family protein [Fusibacter ferrireducens]|uniref:Cytochrome c biogenesis protein CcdA n=1 Tax=Fusibacter ferrireducens TaxID=2785058 RepID=A0ABR9ZUI4_9FIRM|nr:cytochrome c biogenesis CcdA family protein [Fusibacter ferrireducens]MBF4694135.1 cytochrome c biogenesis protein CcdA [Fusibacter ferrireducens]